jgi:organic hydroperoxide reductase OsmC/OhrA
MSTGKVIYTAKVQTTGGRDGTSRSSDNGLNVKLSAPGSGSKVRIRSNYLPPGGRRASKARWERLQDE